MWDKTDNPFWAQDMTVTQLRDLCNEIIAEGKGNYTVCADDDFDIRLQVYSDVFWVQ